MGKRWKSREEEQLLEDYGSSMSIGQIAKNFDRTKASINSKLQRMFGK